MPDTDNRTDKPIDEPAGTTPVSAESTPVRCPGVPIALAATPISSTWNQIAKAGKYEGHPMGSFEFSDKVYDEVIANLARNPNGRIHVDNEHLSETLAGNVAVTGAPAVAWVTKLEKRKGADGPELWGYFEWCSEQAVEQVRAGQYLYLSPAIHFNAIDPVSGDEIGARLSSVALTNDPYIQGMAELTASNRTPEAPADPNAAPAFDIDALATIVAAKVLAAMPVPPKQATAAVPSDTPSIAVAVLGLDVDSVHVPAPIGAVPQPAPSNPADAQRKKTMSDQTTAESVVAALPVAAPVAEPAKPAPAKMCEGTMKLAKLLAEAGHMEHPDSEAAELDVFEKINQAIDKLIAEHKAMTETQTARMKAEAEADTARAMSQHGLTDAQRPFVLALRSHDVAAFNALWPDKPAVQPQTVTAALLSTPVTRTGGPAPAPQGETSTMIPDPMDGDVVHAEAEKLIASAAKANLTLSYTDACMQASRNLMTLSRDMAAKLAMAGNR